MNCLLAEYHRQLILSAVPEPGRILEWGSGGSTRWFLDHLTPRQQLITVEHDPGWAGKVRDECDGAANWQLVLAPSRLPDSPGANATPLEECPAGLVKYIHPTALDDVDVFLIDGVARGACLANVMLNGTKGARVFMHDAHDSRIAWYDWAFQLGKATRQQIIPAPCDQYPAPLWACVLA